MKQKHLTCYKLQAPYLQIKYFRIQSIESTGTDLSSKICNIIDAYKDKLYETLIFIKSSIFTAKYFL